MTDSPAPTNGSTRLKARKEENKRRGVILGQRRVSKGRNRTKGGDDPQSRDRGSVK